MARSAGLIVDALAMLDALVTCGYIAYGWLGPDAPR